MKIDQELHKNQSEVKDTGYSAKIEKGVWRLTRIDPPLLTRIDPLKRLLNSATVLVG
jgi:hypothetical protein